MIDFSEARQSKATEETVAHLTGSRELVEAEDGGHGCVDAAEDEGDDHENNETPPRQLGVTGVWQREGRRKASMSEMKY
jgi:hypothetical protein